VKVHKYLVLFVVCSLILVSAVGCTESPATEGEGQPAPGEQQEPVIITVTDAGGSSQEVDLTTLEMVSGQGGFVKSTGTIVGPFGFTGPRLSAVMDEVGGLEDGRALEIVASDGYTMTFSYDQAQGRVMTYDKEGEALQIGELDVIIAAETDTEEMTEGLPRIVFLSDGTLSDGHFWVKQVAEIKVVSQVGEWEVKLSGIEEAVIDRSTYQSGATCPDTTHPAQTYEDEKKDGSAVVYEGLPLWVLVSMVDGGDAEEGHYRFNRDLAKQGYTVQVIAADGFSVEFTSEEVAYNDDIILAYLADGEPLEEGEGPLRLTGSGLPSKKHAVKQIAVIKLIDLPQ